MKGRTQNLTTIFFKKVKYTLLRFFVSKYGERVLPYLTNITSKLFAKRNMKKCFLLSISGAHEEFFEKGFLIALKSLKITNPNVPIVVFYSDLTLEQKSKLSDCELIEIDKSIFPNCREDLTEATNFRLCLNKISHYDKIINIDGDMVVLGCLKEIFNLPGKMIAVGLNHNIKGDFGESNVDLRKEGINKDYISGFNAGFICFDNRYWKDKIFEEAIQIFNACGDKFANPDQGILNLMAFRRGGFMPVSKHYNFFPWDQFPEIRNNKQGLLAPYVNNNFVKILHFVGPFKPWDREDKSKAEKYPRLKKQLEHYYKCYEQFL